jgi:hypothetical protein
MQRHSAVFRPVSLAPVLPSLNASAVAKSPTRTASQASIAVSWPLARWVETIPALAATQSAATAIESRTRREALMCPHLSRG